MRQPIVSIAEVPSSGSLVVDFFGRPAHVVSGPAGVPAVYMDSCTHFGGPLACREGRLECAWHEASFDLRSGERTSGPAPEGSRLMRLPTVVEDGMVTYVYGE